MALDYGRRRIGVAVSDPTRTIATPRGVIERPVRKTSSPAEPPATLVELVREIRPCIVVVGIPLSMDGTEGEMAREARAFASRLEEATGVPTTGWDERLTTARARREIQALGLRRSQRREKGRFDEMAATLMLTEYLRSPTRDDEGS